MPFRCFAILWLALLSTGNSPFLKAEEPQPDASRLSVQRIFGKPEFEPQSVTVKWLPKGAEYTQLEPSVETKDARDIVRYDALTGRKDVLVSAAMLVPAGQSKPLAVEDYRFSDDLSQVLVFTNSKRVWRHNTRGDFWLLDRSSRELRKLGGDAAASTLMFAKLNPVDRQAAWVKDRNIYLEDLRSTSPRVLTQAATSDVINGTFDWVYEEELELRDGFRWSPDGQFIAYWQMDTSGMRRFPLVNTQTGLYPEVQLIPWPKVGERNPAGRLMIVRVSDGQIRGVSVPGDNRDNYIARIHWRPKSDELLIEQLNRRQNV
ncbi:MAG: DPP IV N-terminal domain-containing protein, partial [Planctomycetaceae bacterium]